MSFQSVLDSIQTKTGKTLLEYREIAKEAGILRPNMRQPDVVEWLTDEHKLSEEQANALYAVLKTYVVKFNKTKNKKYIGKNKFRF